MYGSPKKFVCTIVGSEDGLSLFFLLVLICFTTSVGTVHSGASLSHSTSLFP